MATNLDLIGRDMDAPDAPRQIEKQDIWSKLQSYVQNDARINLNTQALRRVLSTFDNKTLPIASLRILIGSSIPGYQNKKGMQDVNKLDIIIDYMELLQLLIPVSISNPTYIVNLTPDLTEDFDFLSDGKQLFLENVKKYVKLLIK